MTEKEALDLINNMIPGTDIMFDSLRGLGRCEFKINLSKGKTVEESLKMATDLIGKKVDEIVKSINLRMNNG